METNGFNEEWTADVVGRMHRLRISNAALAEACGYNPAYLSVVLNGRKSFKDEASKKATKGRILSALSELEKKIIQESEAKD